MKNARESTRFSISNHWFIECGRSSVTGIMKAAPNQPADKLIHQSAAVSSMAGSISISASYHQILHRNSIFFREAYGEIEGIEMRSFTLGKGDFPMTDLRLPKCPCGSSEWKLRDGDVRIRFKQCFFSCHECGRHGVYMRVCLCNTYEMFQTTWLDGDEVEVEYMAEDLREFLELNDAILAKKAAPIRSIEVPPSPPEGQLLFLSNGHEWVEAKEENWSQLFQPPCSFSFGEHASV